MAFEVTSVSLPTGDTSTSGASLRMVFDSLKLECPTFSTAVPFYIYGSRSVSGTYLPIALVNPSSAATGPPVPAWLGAATTTGGFFLDVAPAIGIKFLTVNLKSALTDSIVFRFIGASKYGYS